MILNVFGMLSKINFLFRTTKINVIKKKLMKILVLCQRLSNSHLSQEKTALLHVSLGVLSFQLTLIRTVCSPKYWLMGISFHQVFHICISHVYSYRSDTLPRRRKLLFVSYRKLWKLRTRAL